MVDRIPTTMVMQEMPARAPTHVLIRGQYDQPGAPGRARRARRARRRRCQAATADRLALARWLVDPANPLTARVAVNRDWQMHFGTGLVEDRRGLRRPGRAAQPSRSCSTGWRPSSSARAGT